MKQVSQSETILIVDDTPTNIQVLMETLGNRGYKFLVAVDGHSALEQIKHFKPSLILLDIMMPGLDGFETCDRLKKNPDTKHIPVIFMTSLTDTQDKVKGFQLGAVDFITKPFQAEEVLSRIATHLRLRQLQEHLEDLVQQRTQELSEALSKVEMLKNQLEAENNYLQEELYQTGLFILEEIETQSPAFRKVLEKVDKVARTDTTVLISGESGTGKELLARALHRRSKRAKKTLVKVNCAALPANLIESELFGHEKGAFTGATQKRIGRFELAHQATLFLDEIGEMPLELQAKLLRVLQEGELERLGSSRTIQVDVRIIAATNRDLVKEVKKGKFREDLYYRLNVFPIHNLPLRDRKEDIPLLVQHFLKKYENQIGKKIEKVPKKVIQQLSDYHWPGNVRELENVIERSMILSIGKKLELENLSRDLHKEADFLSLEEAEKQHILKALHKTRWKVSGAQGAAELLDINHKTLSSKMKKLGIERE